MRDCYFLDESTYHLIQLLDFSVSIVHGLSFVQVSGVDRQVRE
jgi:hypothetical protein